MKRRLISILSMLLIASSALASEPNARQSIEVYEQWKLNCIEKDSKKLCQMRLDILNAQRKPVAVVNVVKPAEDRVNIQFALPHLLSLPKGVNVSVDGKNSRNFSYRYCTSKACMVVVENDAALINDFKAGRTADLEIFNLAEDSLKLPFSLKGFSKALANLPVNQ